MNVILCTFWHLRALFGKILEHALPEKSKSDSVVKMTLGNQFSLIRM